MKIDEEYIEDITLNKDKTEFCIEDSGCGCCTEYDYLKVTEQYSKDIVKRWIANKRKQLDELEELTKD